ncbi:phosphate/phosphite/phosphonate ABC transporter substrate-binding protein [Pseudodesulfovibrio senegalensis]|uniref:Phosphate/phosphite/phosphonate ABC transporter substrate-binding protein n=1 Tax=Pseudodesulfovibrio senegalensis TaxID=1721087 RepID=A0A6N6N362_9BACT|nr:phosphate/phosphite/phosphonate ABC transporter substrate-binding protein [Pseudodesulfovibrio senegalensis]KAB1441482.1 phosphate/phosphite/phosphonate ABC transporter substrate-binding protein [Pseudodesulfovibrio senegalensis]
MQLIRTVVTILLLAAALLCSACSDEETVVKVDMNKRAPITAAKPAESITYAYLPQYSHTISFERHRKLLDYLRNETGLPLRQIFPDTFDEHIKMVERGEIDISYTNPLIYIRLARLGSRAFARIIEPTGSPDFRGQIIIRRDNPLIDSLDDCRGKRWIAVDPGSAGGYLFPLGLFMEHGLDLADFDEVVFAPGPGGKQEKVVLAVNAGAYDIGTIRKGTLDIVRNKIDLDQIRVLAQTRPYPGWVYSARKGLDPDIVERIRRAMFRLTMAREDQADILRTAGMRGIISAQDKDYDPVRALAKKIGMLSGGF